MQISTVKTLIKKGDMVEIIAGREKGKTGKVTKIEPVKSKVFVERLNLVKKHLKPSQKNPRGGVVEQEGAIHISNVLLLCPKCSSGVRVGRKLEKNKWNRVCKKCDQVI